MSSAILSILYPHHDGARFDAAYYVDQHTPAVEAAWKPDGTVLVTGAGAPGGGPAPFAMIAHFSFPTPEALQAALASPKTGELVADVANFTDIQPVMMIGAAA